MNDETDKYTQEEWLRIERMGALIENEISELDWKKTQEKLPNKKTRNQKRKTIITNEYIAENFGIHRSKLSMYINGSQPIDALTLLKFCELLDCEAGYILGEFDEKRRENADIKKVTGLSTKAIESLMQHKDNAIYGKMVDDDNASDNDSSHDDEATSTENTNDSCIHFTSIDKNDILPEHSKYSDVLNYVIEKHPEIIDMIGRILFCKELQLEHIIDESYISRLQKNAASGRVLDNTLEMCMSLALYLFNLTENKKDSSYLLPTEKFIFAQKYINRYVINLTEDNEHFKDEIFNMENDPNYQFGTRPY